jgi:hypothetical protein
VRLQNASHRFHDESSEQATSNPYGRMEMFAAGYLAAKPLADRIFDRVRPAPGNLVKPLEKFASG